MAANLDRSESAIIVPVDLPVPIKRLRDRMDPSAAVGVPGHVTLLYPFMPVEALDERVRGALGRIVATEAAFSFVLEHVERWPDVVYLPPQPAAPFKRLIERLAASFPDYPPYGGAHAVVDIVPHVTIAQAERMDYLDAAVHALPSLLPVRTFCREAWLIAHASGERWRTVWKLPLAGG